MSKEPTEIEIQLKKLEQENQSLTESVKGLEQNVSSLHDKFDVWQSLVEPMLTNWQSAMTSAMTYDTIIIGGLTILIAIAAISASVWFAYSKKEAINSAIEEIDYAISRGILPERSSVREKLVVTIINSSEFQDAVRVAVDYNIKIEEEEEDYADTPPLDDKLNNGESTTSNDVAKARDKDEDKNGK